MGWRWFCSVSGNGLKLDELFWNASKERQKKQSKVGTCSILEASGEGGGKLCSTRSLAKGRLNSNLKRGGLDQTHPIHACV